MFLESTRAVARVYDALNDKLWPSILFAHFLDLLRCRGNEDVRKSRKFESCRSSLPRLRSLGAIGIGDLVKFGWQFRGLNIYQLNTIILKCLKI